MCNQLSNKLLSSYSRLLFLQPSIWKIGTFLGMVNHAFQFSFLLNNFSEQQHTTRWSEAPRNPKCQYNICLSPQFKQLFWTTTTTRWRLLEIRNVSIIFAEAHNLVSKVINKQQKLYRSDFQTNNLLLIKLDTTHRPDQVIL